MSREASLVFGVFLVRVHRIRYGAYLGEAAEGGRLVPKHSNNSEIKEGKKPKKTCDMSVVVHSVC
jgi:hypothetical protein